MAIKVEKCGGRALFRGGWGGRDGPYGIPWGLLQALSLSHHQKEIPYIFSPLNFVFLCSNAIDVRLLVVYGDRS